MGVPDVNDIYPYRSMDSELSSGLDEMAGKNKIAWMLGLEGY